MRTMKTLLIIITIALLIACTSVHDVSNVSPFQTKIGAKTLIVNAFICKVDERGSFAKGLPKYRIIKNNGFEKCPLGEHINSLQKGEVVHITSASHRSHWGLFHSDHWYLVGSAIVNGKKHNFYNYLGLTTNGLPPDRVETVVLW